MPPDRSSFRPLDLQERQGAAQHSLSAGGRTQVDWTPVWPPPSDVPAPSFVHPKHGQPTGIYYYNNSAGRLLMAVLRFDPPAGKTYGPLTFCQNASGRREWRWKNLASDRPLYGLDRLAARPDAPVLWSEGEKAADAAGRIFLDHVAIASNGGAKAVGKSDWSSLAGRDLIIWPDADAPGRRAVNDVGKLAAAAGARSVRVVEVPAAWPPGWDLADPVPADA